MDNNNQSNLISPIQSVKQFIQLTNASDDVLEVFYYYFLIINV